VFTARQRTDYIALPGNCFEQSLLIFGTQEADMSKPRTIRWVLLIAAVAGLSYFGWQRFHGDDHAAQADNAQKQGPAQKRAPAPVAVPVKIATVEKADFPVYLTGLGTVQGFNTVLVRTRVDGQINKIAFQEGQFVKEGDTLVEIDPRPFQAALDQAKAKKAQDEANRANASLDLQRFTKLGEFATRQQTDTQRSTVAQLTAQIEADAAAVSNAQTQLDYATIKAPISGVAGLRQVDVGNIVNAATQTGIVTVVQIEPIAVIFTAPEDQLPDIRSALATAPPKTIALSTDGKRVLSRGTLALINNQVDTSSGTIRLKAVFDNKDHALWPGQSVSTRLLIATLKDATVVPDDAVQHGTDGLYAFTVDKDNKAALRKIKVTRSIDGRSVIDEGLSPGEQVITAGQYKVQAGTLVSTAVASSDAAQVSNQAKVAQE
jgi:multidrug efflux system membrane fusion protein